MRSRPSDYNFFVKIQSRHWGFIVIGLILHFSPHLAPPDQRGRSGHRRARIQLDPVCRDGHEGRPLQAHRPLGREHHVPRIAVEVRFSKRLFFFFKKFKIRKCLPPKFY